jgi:hypothetical protein
MIKIDKEKANEIRTFIQDTKQSHRYSTSKIYGYTNYLFEKNEQPSTCRSCVLNHFHQIEQWIADYDARIRLLVDKMQEGRRKAKEAKGNTNTSADTETNN